MREEGAEKKSFRRELTSKDTWVPPACGFVASVLVSVIGRATGFEHRSDAAFATFLLVATLVSSYRSEFLKEKPLLAIGWSLAWALVAVASAFLFA
jgi:hypothetical protein